MRRFLTSYADGIGIAVQITQALLNAEEGGDCSTVAEGVMIGRVLPKLRQLLFDQAPIPQLAMKMVVLVLQRWPTPCAGKLEEEDMLLPILQNVALASDTHQGGRGQVKPCRYLLGIVAILLDIDNQHWGQILVESKLTQRLVVIVRMLFDVHSKHRGMHLQEWLEPLFMILHSLFGFIERNDNLELQTTEDLEGYTSGSSEIVALFKHQALRKLIGSLCKMSTDVDMRLRAETLRNRIDKLSSKLDE